MQLTRATAYAIKTPPPNLGGVTNVPGAIVGGARDTVGGVGSAVGGLLGQ